MRMHHTQEATNTNGGPQPHHRFRHVGNEIAEAHEGGEHIGATPCGVTDMKYCPGVPRCAPSGLRTHICQVPRRQATTKGPKLSFACCANKCVTTSDKENGNQLGNCMDRDGWIDFHDKRRLKDARNRRNVAEKIEMSLSNSVAL